MQSRARRSARPTSVWRTRRTGFGDVTHGYSRPRCRKRTAPAAGEDPHPVPAAGRRCGAVSRQAHRRRPRRGLGRRVPRRPREAPRRRPAPARGRRASGPRPSCTRSTRTTTASAGAARSSSTGPGAGSGRSRPGPTSSPPGATSCGASSRPASTTSRASSARACCCSRTAAAGAKGPDKKLIEHALRVLSDDGDPRGGQARRRARHRALRRGRAQRRAPRRDAAGARRSPCEVDRVRARFGSWYELFPRSWGGLAGVQEQLPRLAELGFDVVYLPPIHPIGTTNRKGKNNVLVAAPGGPRLALRHRLRGGRPRRRPPRARHPRGRPRAVRRRRRARHRHRARPRDQRVARPPVAQGAPGLVPPPPGRDAQVRGEPAQEVPGHLQRQLGHRGLARALGRAASGSSCCGSSSA